MASPVSSLLTLMKDLISIELCDGAPLTSTKLESVLLKSVTRTEPEIDGAGIEDSEIAR